MKTRRFLWPFLLSLLFACAPLRTEIPLPEVPAGPLAGAVARRQEAFRSLKAVGRVRVERQGRTRTYESVSFLQKGFDRLRIEAYGVMGEPLVAVLWDGTEVIVVNEARSDVHRMGPAGIERLLGVPLSPLDLCAALSGNGVPAPPEAAVRAGCRADGRCVVEYRSGDARWLVTVDRRGSSVRDDVVVDAVERYQSGRLVFRGRFMDVDAAGAYPFPKRVVLESPERRTTVDIRYDEVDVNVPVEDAEFVLPGEDAR